jgi:hypothetical protein
MDGLAFAPDRGASARLCEVFAEEGGADRLTCCTEKCTMLYSQLEEVDS